MIERLDGVCGRCLHWHLRGTPCIGVKVVAEEKLSGLNLIDKILKEALFEKCAGHSKREEDGGVRVDFFKPCAMCKTND